MDSIYDLETDKDLEKSGVWHDVGQTDDGQPIGFLLSILGETNEEYSVRLAEMRERWGYEISNDTISETKRRELQMEMFVGTVLKGWRNITNRQKQPMEFTPENAKQLFTDIPHIYERLRYFAADPANFKAKRLKDEAGNSPESSGGEPSPPKTSD